MDSSSNSCNFKTDGATNLQDASLLQNCCQGADPKGPSRGRKLRLAVTLLRAVLVRTFGNPQERASCAEIRSRLSASTFLESVAQGVSGVQQRHRVI